MTRNAGRTNRNRIRKPTLTGGGSQDTSIASSSSKTQTLKQTNAAGRESNSSGIGIMVTPGSFPVNMQIRISMTARLVTVALLSHGTMMMVMSRVRIKSRAIIIVRRRATFGDPRRRRGGGRHRGAGPIAKLATLRRQRAEETGAATVSAAATIVIGMISIARGRTAAGGEPLPASREVDPSRGLGNRLREMPGARVGAGFAVDGADASSTRLKRGLPQST